MGPGGALQGERAPAERPGQQRGHGLRRHQDQRGQGLVNRLVVRLRSELGEEQRGLGGGRAD
ncbi:hypothetical protein QEZ40_000481 [Streptomyces katrae]|uniref:Uncharacterized protein n=1 Tax=Streptomyces katrae TaxID=68223 RepID=A0ABT7GS71_9ACTN|nr:hypothetical protein [Streptomyces katrae]MDK9496139.1 hypothetical protein [Streptomyces katrae]